MSTLKSCPTDKRMALVSLFVPRSTVTSRNPLRISAKCCCYWQESFDLNLAPGIEKFWRLCSNFIPTFFFLFSSSSSFSLLVLVLLLRLNRRLLKSYSQLLTLVSSTTFLHPRRYRSVWFVFYPLIFFRLTQQPPVGQGLHGHEVSRSHTTTHHSR